MTNNVIPVPYEPDFGHALVEAYVPAIQACVIDIYEVQDGKRSRTRCFRALSQREAEAYVIAWLRGYEYRDHPR